MLLETLLATADISLSTEPSVPATSWISLILSVITALTAIASVYIARKTLEQSSQNIEASTRPYIKPYLAVTYVQTVSYYLVIKNFGASSAKILGFKAENFDWTPFVYKELGTPFQNIVNAELPPGHKIYTYFDPVKTKQFLEETNQKPYTFNITLTYKSETGQIYTEETTINMHLYSDLCFARPSQPDDEYSLKMIANGIIELGEQKL
jgi:hypothetical protein